jgi:UDP-N-acetylmuramate--alanine ligase
VGDLTIQDLMDKVEQGKLLTLENINVLKQYEDAVLIFMGAGDIQKFQLAYEKCL